MGREATWGAEEQERCYSDSPSEPRLSDCQTVGLPNVQASDTGLGTRCDSCRRSAGQQSLGAHVLGPPPSPLLRRDAIECHFRTQYRSFQHRIPAHCLVSSCFVSANVEGHETASCARFYVSRRQNVLYTSAYSRQRISSSVSCRMHETRQCSRDVL